MIAYGVAYICGSKTYTYHLCIYETLLYNKNVYICVSSSFIEDSYNSIARPFCKGQTAKSFISLIHILCCHVFWHIDLQTDEYFIMSTPYV